MIYSSGCYPLHASPLPPLLFSLSQHCLSDSLIDNLSTFTEVPEPKGRAKEHVYPDVCQPSFPSILPHDMTLCY